MTEPNANRSNTTARMLAIILVVGTICSLGGWMLSERRQAHVAAARSPSSSEDYDAELQHVRAQEQQDQERMDQDEAAFKRRWGYDPLKGEKGPGE